MPGSRAIFLTAAVILAGTASRASATPTLTTVVSFQGFGGETGYNPISGVTLDASGNIFGATEGGGTIGEGTVYDVDHNTHAISTLVSFVTSNGQQPITDLTADSNGNLYGTTEGGGAANSGTVFEIAAGTHAFTTIATLGGSYGIGPNGAVVFDAHGNLFGSTERGGPFNDGTIFEIAAGTHAESTLVTFVKNGSGSGGNLVIDSSGNLYAVSGFGGAGSGNIFKVSTATKAVTPLANFTYDSGYTAGAGLTMDTSGNLFGTTLGGANGHGSVFELPAGSTTPVALASFPKSNSPYSDTYSSLIIDAAGDLFGTTRFGGTYGLGEVFEVVEGSNTLTTLISFNGSNGSQPQSDLTVDPQGNLFGTTYAGGQDDVGTIFELSGTGFVVVPEPATLGMVVAGALGMLGRRRNALR